MNTTTEAPALADLVRQAIEKHPASATSADIARDAMEAIPDALLRDVLLPALSGYVTSMRGEMRRHPTAPRSAALSNGLSPKVARAVQSNWQRIINTAVSLGPNQFKAFGDCTADDLTYAATARQRLAAQHEAWASRYASYAEALRTAGAARVADAPEWLRERIETDLT